MVSGRVAEWSCSGLQIRVRRFDSGLGLQAVVRRSSMAEHSAVNRRVVGSNPTAGAIALFLALGAAEEILTGTKAGRPKLRLTDIKNQN